MQDKNKKSATVFEALKKIALLGGHNPSVEQLKAMSTYLADFDLKNVLHGLKKCVEISYRFPAISDIRNAMNLNNSDEDDINPEIIVGNIFEALKQFGYMNIVEVREYLGPEAWKVVELSGGWEDLCKVQYSQIPTVRAQLRDICKGLSKTLKKASTGRSLSYSEQNTLKTFKQLTNGFEQELKIEYENDLKLIDNDSK